ncbi:MAG: VUT family protein [Deltaproteobacteria bacterium]|nr:VUT family protein [Deltaproteobacteria bacterium]
MKLQEVLHITEEKVSKMLRAMILYISAVLAANYTATWFMPLPIFGMVSVGTLIFGITFTARDHVHKHGRTAVYAMIFVAAAGMVLESLFLAVEWRIIAASFIAIILSETADTEIYQKLLHRSWILRVMGSNSVSIPLDSILFNVFAFAGLFPAPTLISIIFGEIVAKFAAGAIVALWKSSEPTARTKYLSLTPE